MDNNTIRRLGTGETSIMEARLRIERLKNQRELEQGVESIRGDAIDRIRLIRLKIYQGQDTVVSDYRPLEIRQEPASAGKYTFAHHRLVEESFFPAYLNLLDDLYKGIQELKTGKLNDPDKYRYDDVSVAGFRLAVLCYTLGILMHPFPDGNGQTFRMLALSYVREFCPEYSDRFFPFRDVSRSGKNISSATRYVEETREELVDKEWMDMIAVSDLMDKVPTNDGSEDAEKRYANWITEVKDMFPETKDMEDDEIFDYMMELDTDSLDFIYGDKGYHRTQLGRLHYFLDYLLNSRFGEPFIREYVFDYEDTILESMYVRRAASAAFHNTEASMRHLLMLETHQQHEQSLTDRVDELEAHISAVGSS